MTIGQRIRKRREELQLSQDELAKRIGYKSRSSINKIELDLYNLKQSKIKAIADALDTSPAYIMGWEDEKKPTPETEDGPDELDVELMNFVKRLTSDQKKLLMAQIQLMLQQEQ